MRRPTGARPQDLNVRPAVCRWVAGNAPPLSSLLTSSECTFTQKHESAHAWEHTHTQCQPTVFGACGAVFRFGHLFCHLTGVGAVLFLTLFFHSLSLPSTLSEDV